MSKLAEQPKLKYYRPNVALLMLNKRGQLLICERIGQAGAWQFPQGGVDEGEGAVEALLREVREEIGLLPKQYKLIDTKGGYRYKYPPGFGKQKKRKHNCIGQEQTYFLCRMKVPKKAVNVNQTPAEFQACKWIEPSEFRLKWLPKFKRKVYKQVFMDFFGCEIK